MSFDGEVKIADFGLAKAKQRVTQTAIGITKGEPAYMSPEQVCGQQLDGRSDIFALGVLLYELFAQRRPWKVTNVKHALTYIVEGEPPDLGRACPNIDRALIQLVNRCLAKKKEERFQSAAEVKAQLDRWLHLHGYTDSRDHLARFVRRNAMRQMRWVDRVIAGEQVDAGPSPFELSNEAPPPPLEEPRTRAEAAPSRSGLSHSGLSRTRADSRSAARATHDLDASDTSISEVDEPEATTMRRQRAATITVTNIPEEAREVAAAAAEESVLDLRTHDDDSAITSRPPPGAGSSADLLTPAVAGTPAAPPVPTPLGAPVQPPPRVKPRARAETEVTNIPEATVAKLREEASHITRAAAKLADEAEAAADKARRAADHAELAAGNAKDMARRAQRAAKAARLASEAMEKLASGADDAAAEALKKAKDQISTS
jgi:hypothetical protein